MESVGSLERAARPMVRLEARPRTHHGLERYLGRCFRLLVLRPGRNCRCRCQGDSHQRFALQLKRVHLLPHRRARNDLRRQSHCRLHVSRRRCFGPARSAHRPGLTDQILQTSMCAKQRRGQRSRGGRWKLPPLIKTRVLVRSMPKLRIPGCRRSSQLSYGMVR